MMVRETQARKIHSIYTDGSYCPESKTGGWGIVIFYEDGSCSEIGGSVPETSISRMEIYAAIMSLRFINEIRQHKPVTLYVDSDSLLLGATRLLRKWKKNGWRNKRGLPVKDCDLWKLVDALNSNLILWKRIPAHKGTNKICDAIARMFALKRIPISRRSERELIFSTDDVQHSDQ